jgi:hypothetical protein
LTTTLNSFILFCSYQTRSMITRKSALFKTLLSWQHTIRWIEFWFFFIYLTSIGYIIYTNWVCQNQICDLNVNRVDIGLLIQIAFTISGIINSIRIALVYEINDRDPKPEKWFFFALILLAFTYSIFGYYFKSDISGFIKYSDNVIAFSILALSMFISIAIFLTDKQTWHKNSFFVQTRITLCIINQIILFISPVLGFFSTLVFIPALMFINGKPAKVDEVM